MNNEIRKLDDEKLCKELIDAYRKRDYYGDMCEVADRKIAALTTVMSWEDIKYCIERTSKK